MKIEPEQGRWKGDSDGPFLGSISKNLWGLLNAYLRVLLSMLGGLHTEAA